MPIFSNHPSIMKAVVGKEIMTNINLIILTRLTRMSLKELFHQEGLGQIGTKITLLDIFFLAIILA
jgi:hypothetical protein